MEHTVDGMEVIIFERKGSAASAVRQSFPCAVSINCVQKFKVATKPGEPTWFSIINVATRS